MLLMPTLGTVPYTEKACIACGSRPVMARQPSCLKTLLRLQAAVYSELLKANTILYCYHTTE